VVGNSEHQAVRRQYYHYVPPDIPLSAIRRFARRVAEKFDPDKIILFGSFAYGTPHEWSDVDLLVVMDTPNEISQATRIKLAFDREFPLDLIVRTPNRLRFWLAQGESFLQEITGKGIVLYDSPRDRPGSGPWVRAAG
jgi:predicted nucleotidyltransferase